MKHEKANEEVLELAALFALGGLSEHEARAFERHIREGCAVCEGESATFKRAAEAMSFGAVAVTPSRHLRDSLMSRIALEPRIGNAQSIAGRSDLARETSKRRAPVLGWAVAASLLIVSVTSLLYWRRSNEQVTSLQNQVAVLQTELIREMERGSELAQISDLLKRGARVVTLTSVQEAQPPAVELYVDTPNNQWFVSANLSPTPAGKVYQLWFVTPSEKISAGLIRTDQSGHGFVKVRVPAGIGKVDAAAITLEPDGGSSQPTPPIVAVGKLG